MVSVEGAMARQAADGTYQIDVTLRHGDTGWEHYADRWEILTPQGDVIATRILHHPHVEEQPLTRSLRNVRLPEGLKMVLIRAHDNKHGYGVELFELQLP